MPDITLKAPLGGLIYPIEEIPDPVFSQKMVGDGLSIDPTDSILYAPLDGTVTQLHRALHAVTMTHSSGLQVMMHIGLDTVELKSKGFRAHIEEGQNVSIGDKLISFDMDYIAMNAKSLLTQIVIINMEMVESIKKTSGIAIANKSELMRVKTKDEFAMEPDDTEADTIISEKIIIPNTTGLHARPAAVLAGIAKKYGSKINIEKNSISANAKSITAIMGLDISCRDEVQISATGSDAREAIVEIIPQLKSGLGDEGITAIAEPENKEDSAAPKSGNPGILRGIAASSGIAIGTAVQIAEEIFDFKKSAADADEEKMRLHNAINEAKKQLQSLIAKMKKQDNSSKAAIFEAHQEILDDPELTEKANKEVFKGKSAEYAWHKAYTSSADKLEKLENKLLAERANDLRDAGRRVLRILTGKENEIVEIPDDAILIAEDITPSFVAGIDIEKVKAFCSTGGGATSHVAIIARSLDIPAIAGIESRALNIPDGTPLILDGNEGILRLNPSNDLLQEIEDEQNRRKKEKEKNLASAIEPAVTTDGKKVEVVANIGGVEDAVKSVELGGEGVGLLRSEFLFLNRNKAPSEEEQFEIYKNILEKLDSRPLLIRTLDVGGDKPLPYLPLPKEENPFLGIRGIRIGLEKPEILRSQLRAILRAGKYGKVRVMFPMISTIDEFREAKAILEEERENQGVDPIETGIMVEVPSTAILAEYFAKEADFFSIGTNDLTQYTMAMDRGHPKLAAKADPLDPSVLRLIDMTAKAAHNEGKWIGVCGGLASEPKAVPILLGLGIDELSASVPVIPDIKAEIRKYSMSEVREIAAEALNCATASEVHEVLKSARKKK